jgi:hypothetical protein
MEQKGETLGVKNPEQKFVVLILKSKRKKSFKMKAQVNK